MLESVSDWPAVVLFITLPGGSEWIIILFIVLLLFGARKLPDLAGSMGRSIKEFRRSVRDAASDEEAEGTDPDDAQSSAHAGEDKPNSDGNGPASPDDETPKES